MAVSDQLDIKTASPGGHGGPAGERTKTDLKRTRRVLLDLGFGCGDQTLYLMQKQDESGGTATPLFSRYIGITIDKTQFDFAKARIDAAKSSDSHTRAEDEDTTVFCADAADPSSWPTDLRQSICAAFTEDRVQCERYVLALDTLYHFRPSRCKIFQHSHSSLRAHFLAYDLFLATPSSHTLKTTLNTLLTRILAPALSAPYSNLLTPAAYRTQLREAGYADEDISIEDITEDVFPGLAGFLENRQREIKALGLSGFTKWRISGWLFRWLAGGDVLRAGIVVAKWRPNQSTG
jgi:poly(rC)-binding protein 2/3/4